MLSPKRLLLFVAVAFSLAAFAFTRHARQQNPAGLTLTPYHSDGIYALGEKAGWTIALAEGASAPAGAFSYVLRKNNFNVIKSGSLTFDSGKATVEATLDEPAMLYLRIEPSAPSPADAGNRRDRGISAGAAIEPTKLQPSLQRPADFDEFWASKLAELAAIPINPVLTPGESGWPGGAVDYATIKMDHINGAHVYGQFAKPSKEGKYPALLILQWASPPYPLQKPWVVNYASEGWLTLNIEPHDVLPDQPQAYYDALPAELKNYAAIGRDDREKSYFLQMYLADYRAVEYLASRPDWDGKTLVVLGTSMGGQQSLCVAGLNPKITHVIAEEPSGCDLDGALHGRQTGYPNFPSNDPKAMAAAPYFDAVNFASNIKAKCLVAMGFVDTVAPPAGIWTAFNQIKGPKEAAPMVDAPHNNIATALQQKPYSTAANSWLARLLRGEKVL